MTVALVGRKVENASACGYNALVPWYVGVLFWRRGSEQQRVRVVRGEIGKSGREREKSDDENGVWHGFGSEFIFNDVFSEMLLAVSSGERVDVVMS